MLTIVQNAKLLPNRHQTFCEAFPGVPKLPKLSGVSNQNLVGLVFPTVYRLEGRALVRVAAHPSHPVGPPLTYTPVVLWLTFSRRSYLAARRRKPCLANQTVPSAFTQYASFFNFGIILSLVHASLTSSRFEGGLHWELFVLVRAALHHPTVRPVRPPACCRPLPDLSSHHGRHW